jgi:hypothetical protein
MHAAFAAGITTQGGLHRDSLLDAPKNWKQMLVHPEHIQSIGNLRLLHKRNWTIWSPEERSLLSKKLQKQGA